MSVLWVIPLLFIAVGAALLALTVRRMAEAAVRLRQECAELADLHAAVVALRTDSGATRATLERVRTRSELDSGRR